MEFRSLKYLLSLSDRGSFTAAAEAHFVTQPAISAGLRKLQDELGTKLFELRGKKVVFTRAGEMVLDYARRFSRLEHEMLRQVRDLEGLRRGSISLGTIDAASIYVLPDIFSRFNALYPGIEIHLEIDSTIPLLDGLGRGELDLVVGTLPLEDNGRVRIFPVYTEPLAIIAPPAHPLAGRRSLSPGSLSEFRFISFNRGSVTRRIVENGFKEKGIVPRTAMVIDSPEAIKKLVASGLGLAVLPLRIVKDDVSSGRISVLNVRGLRFERRLGLIVPADRYLSSTVRAFLGVLGKGLGVKLPRSMIIEPRNGAGARRGTLPAAGSGAGKGGSGGMRRREGRSENEG